MAENSSFNSYVIIDGAPIIEKIYIVNKIKYVQGLSLKLFLIVNAALANYAFFVQN